eukprot:gene1182-4396_t
MSGKLAAALMAFDNRKQLRSSANAFIIHFDCYKHMKPLLLQTP